jgi:uncharacterized protein (TIGR03032 family)
MQLSESPASGDPSESPPEKWREVRYRHSSTFVDVLREICSTLVVSTYQAGKLVAIGVADGSLHFSFHNLDQAMGVAVGPRRVAVGAKGQIWFFDNNSQIAPTLEPAGRFDACYLARSAHVTGGIHCHEMAWSGDELWVVNTLFSCLSTLHDEYSFVPRWRPPFITDLAGEDRCHLNGLAMRDGKPAFVTVMAESNDPAGWRPNKCTTGCLLDVATGAVVTGGMAMPHSPRWHQGRLWVLHSGYGTLEVVDPSNGHREVVAAVPGYTRGLAICGPFAFIGLSRIRETAVFGGVPIAERRDELKCGIGVVDLRTGSPIASLQFATGVEEIFDVQVLPGSRCAAICGPRPDQDGAQDIWIVPRPDQVERLLADRPPGKQATGQPLVENAHALVQQALALQRERRFSEAVSLLNRATQLQPHSGEVWNHLGNVLQDAGQQEKALGIYRQAVSVDPNFAPALQNLGYVLVAQGHTDEGVKHLQDAQRVKPAVVNHALIATALPVIYESLEDLRIRRHRLMESVQRLVEEKVAIDTTHTLIPTNFFAVYQGENDRDLQENLGRVYRGLDLCQNRGIGAAGSRIRVGYLTA